MVRWSTSAVCRLTASASCAGVDDPCVVLAQVTEWIPVSVPLQVHGVWPPHVRPGKAAAAQPRWLPWPCALPAVSLHTAIIELDPQHSACQWNESRADASKLVTVTAPHLGRRGCEDRRQRWPTRQAGDDEFGTVIRAAQGTRHESMTRSTEGRPLLPRARRTKSWE